MASDRAQSKLQDKPLDPESVLALANKDRGLYQDQVARLQDPRPDLPLPGLELKYVTRPVSFIATSPCFSRNVGSS